MRLSATPKGSLYHYFPGGKDQLAIETLGHVAAQLEQRMSTLLDSSDDPSKALRNLLDFTVKNFAESDFRNGCPIAAVTLDVACASNSIREACERGFDTWLNVFVRKLRRSGLTEKRAKRLATLFLAALEGGAILSRAQKSVAPLKAIADELVQVIQASLAAHS